MRKSRFSEDQIIGILKEHQAGIEPASAVRLSASADPAAAGGRGDKPQEAVQALPRGAVGRAVRMGRANWCGIRRPQGCGHTVREGVLIQLRFAYLPLNPG